MRSRFAWGAVGLGAVAMLVAAAYLLQILRISGHVAMPSKTASPKQVVATYIHALNEHDCDTAAALWVPSAAAEGRQWCTTVEHVTATDLQELSVPLGPQLTTISARISVDKRMLSNDDTLPANPFGWSFTLSHGVQGWRIASNGQG
jgi:hypothetical protein